jgi:2-polyprenyl-6-methoxyphenol hydroxylase-like FAD-dependent oxidoreductase
LDKNMPNIFIAGAGPVGLYTAIVLKHLYKNSVTVTVLDAHSARYDRPGVIAPMAVDAINEFF